MLRQPYEPQGVSPYPAAYRLNTIKHNKWISKTAGRGGEEMTLGFKLVLHVFTQMMCPARGEIQASPAADLPSRLCSQPDAGFLVRKTWFIARVDTVSHNSELADDYSVDTLREAAAAARQHPHQGGEVVRSHTRLLQTPQSLQSLGLLRCHLLSLALQNRVLPALPPASLLDTAPGRICLSHWGLQLFLALACAICLFPEQSLQDLCLSRLI